MLRPYVEYASFYYLNSLNSDILIIIQSMSGTSLPHADNIGIRVENSHIQGRKIAPRLPMPYFLDI